MLPLQGACPDCEVEGITVPAISCSATSRDSETLLSFANLDPTADYELEIAAPHSRATMRLLTSDVMTAHNTFDAPDTVSPVTHAVMSDGQTVQVTLPRHSLLTITLQHE